MMEKCWSVWAGLCISVEGPVWGTCCWEPPAITPSCYTGQRLRNNTFTHFILTLVHSISKQMYRDKKIDIENIYSVFKFFSPSRCPLSLIQIPELALCVCVCVWNYVSVSTLDGGGWKLPTPAGSSVHIPPPPPAPLYTVGLSPTKGGITV